MNYFRKLSIRTQMLIISTLIIAIIPFVIIRVYQESKEIIINQNTLYNAELVSQMKQGITSKYANISSIIVNLGYDTGIQDFLLTTDPGKTYDVYKKVDSLIGVVKNLNQDIVDITIVGETGKYASYSGIIQHAIQANDYSNNSGGVQYFGFLGKDIFSNQERFHFGMNIYASGATARYGEKIGFISIQLDARSINTELKNFSRLAETHFYMLDSQKIVYTNSNNNGLAADIEQLFANGKYSEAPTLEKIQGKSYAIQSFALPEINGKIIILVPISNLVKELKSLQKVSYLLLFITLLVLFISYSALMMNLLKPLSRLMAFMKKLKSGNLELLHTKVQLEGYAEIEVISNQFNSMLERINDLTDQLVQTTTRLYQSDLEKQQAKFSFLQSQINPHFLSNTLDSIKGIALVNGNQDIYTMTASLSSMFRYSIKGSDEVTLQEELKIVVAYITIHQGRFPGRISYSLDCPDELNSARIPKMILQPIVENALCHGLEPHAAGGEVRISATLRDNDCLEIIVNDNGIGISSERLDELIAMLNDNNPESSPNRHIGMKNVNERIRLMYGDEYGISLDSLVGVGTCVKVTFPIRP